jgi:hypothetical protein
MPFRDTDATIGPRAGVVALYRPQPSESPVPRHLWGVRAGEILFLPGLPHMAELSYRPEGMSARVTCPRCAAQDEFLLDVRDSVEPYPDDASESGLEAHMHRVLHALPARFGPEAIRLLGEFIPAHTACSADQVPPSPPMTPSFQRAVDALLRRMRAAIGRGQQLPPAQYVFTADGTAMEVPITDAPAGAMEGVSGRARTEHLELLHWMLRDHFRANAVDPEAILVLSEAWMSVRDTPSEDNANASALPDPAVLKATRQEVVMAVMTTRERTYSACAEIRRDGGTIDEGTGTVGPLVWEPQRLSGSLSGGLLMHCASPLPPAVLARATTTVRPPTTPS